jgi:hypothetical protein
MISVVGARPFVPYAAPAAPVYPATATAPAYAYAHHPYSYSAPFQQAPIATSSYFAPYMAPMYLPSHKLC